MALARKSMEGSRLPKTGYMEKEGTEVKSWKKRWFELKEGPSGAGLLVYHEDQATLNSKGSYDLRHCRLLTTTGLDIVLERFKTTAHDGRLFKMRASSEKEADTWKRAIQSWIIKIALVTGGNRGIGKETCKQLAVAGCSVYLGARQQSAANSAAKELKHVAKLGGSVEALKFDVNSSKDIAAGVKLIEEKHGRLDILINNAGCVLDPGGPTAVSGLAVTRDELMSTFDVNVFRPVEVVQAFSHLLKAAPAARVVNQSSILGSMASHQDPTVGTHLGKPLAYASSKAALNMCTIMLAEAFKGTNVKVNSSHPGWVRTAGGGGNVSPKQLDVPEGAKTAVDLALDSSMDSPNASFSHKGNALGW